MQLVLAILAVLLGALFAFGGWRFFLILLPFWGFFMGFNIGTEATRSLIGDGTFATITSWAIGIVLALVFAVFAYLYYYAAIAVLAGTVGFIIGSSLWGLIGSLLFRSFGPATLYFPAALTGGVAIGYTSYAHLRRKGTPASD